jgi:hypothetical protein
MQIKTEELIVKVLGSKKIIVALNILKNQSHLQLIVNINLEMDIVSMMNFQINLKNFKPTGLIIPGLIKHLNLFTQTLNQR